MNPSLRRSRTSRMSRTWTSPRAISASTCSTDRFSIRVFASSTICPTVFLGFHIGAPSVLYRRTAGEIRQCARGREPADVVPRALGQGVGRALESPKPTVDVALEDARRVGHDPAFAQRLQARLATALDEHGAAQRFLSICGDDRCPRDAAAVRITDAPRVLTEEAGQAGHAPTRPVGDWIHDHLDAGRRAPGRDHDQAEPEPPTQVTHVTPMDRPASSAAAPRSADREIDAVRQREPIDALEHERQAEGELELDDHRWLLAPRRDDVAAPDLRLDVVALTFEEGFHSRIEVALDGCDAASPHRRDSTR